MKILLLALLPCLLAQEAPPPCASCCPPSPPGYQDSVTCDNLVGKLKMLDNAIAMSSCDTAGIITPSLPTFANFKACIFRF